MDQPAANPFGTTPPAPPAEPTTPAGERRGNIAEGIFDEVERMTAGGGMTRSDAFEVISTRTGRRAGTVAANYYRIARKRGTVAPRARRGSGRPAVSATAGDAAAVIARLEAATRDLADLVRAQDAELTRLRAQSEQFEKLREWMAANG